MPSRLSSNIASQVIQQWLRGEQRDKIAGDNGLSGGAVTNIVNDWRQSLGFSSADELRDLATAMRKIGVTATQCAIGYRVAMMMNRLGIKEDSFESFMSDTYNKCKNLELTPENIAYYLSDLLEFAKSVPFSKITDYIQQKTDKKENLEQEIKNLEDNIDFLKAEKSNYEAFRDSALEDMKLTKEELRSYSSLKEELGKYGIPVDDVTKLSQIVKGIRQYGYNVQNLVEDFSNLQLLKAQFKTYREQIPILEQQHNRLNQECSSRQETLNSWNQTISTCCELSNMRFGLKELRLLHHTITEIAVANKIPTDEATTKFFKDIYKQYDDKLGFESEIDRLRSEISKLNQEEVRLRSQMMTLPLVSPSLIRLLQKGVSEQDIVDVAELLENSGGTSNDNKRITMREIRSLIAELHTFGSIKLTIKQLSQKVNNLRGQVISLRAEKQNLVYSIQYSKNLLGFFSGLSVSLRNEIMCLISAMSCSILLLNTEKSRTQKSLGGDNDDSLPVDSEFMPLAMAARGQASDLEQLKIALAKAIEVFQERLSSNGKLKKILSSAKRALLNEQL
jgi:hypothetical protein